MSNQENLQQKQKQQKEIPITPKVSRPVRLIGVTYKTLSSNGNIFTTINHDDKGNIFEIFLNSGKNGSDIMALADALGRIITFVLRIHSPLPVNERIRDIISELNGLSGTRSIEIDNDIVRSFPDTIAKVLEKHCGFDIK